VRKIERVAPHTHPERSKDTGIGAILRQARTDRGLSLAELQARTKVRARFLAALEDERLHDLPPYPFTRGFLHTVALELELDPAPLLARLEAAMAATVEPSVDGWRRLDGAIRPAVPPSRLRRVALTVGALAAVAVAVLAVFFFRQLRQLSEPAPAAMPPAAVVPGAPAAAPTPEPLPVEAPGPTPGPAAGPISSPEPRVSPGTAAPRAEGVAVEVRATERSWLLVVADESTVFEGFVTAGQIRRWEARTAIRIRAGNAGAVALVVDGRTIGPLGLPGEVVDRTFPRDATR
jgi:cytoskeletal protein RodZ